MYVQVVTYALNGINENEYLDVASELASRFSAMSGLQAKIWLEDPDLHRYGAIYFWEDRESMERFLRSDLFEGTNPEFVEVDSEGFGILANLTAQTQPALEVVPPPRRPAVGRGTPTAAAKKSVAKKAPATRGAVAKQAAATALTTGKATAKKATAKKAARKTTG